MENLINLNVDKLQKLQEDREKTMSDSEFIKWFKEMRVATRLQKNPMMETDRHHFETDKINFKFKF